MFDPVLDDHKFGNEDQTADGREVIDLDIENVGLVAALEFLLKDTIENHRFAAPSIVEDELTFLMQVQLQVYRIAQEVLANIKRHSNAGFVEMTLDCPEDEFVLLIDDDGDQFDPATAAMPPITSAPAMMSPASMPSSLRSRAIAGVADAKAIAPAATVPTSAFEMVFMAYLTIPTRELLSPHAAFLGESR